MKGIKDEIKKINIQGDRLGMTWHLKCLKIVDNKKVGRGINVRSKY